MHSRKHALPSTYALSPTKAGRQAHMHGGRQTKRETGMLRKRSPTSQVKCRQKHIYMQIDTQTDSDTGIPTKACRLTLKS